MMEVQLLLFKQIFEKEGGGKGFVLYYKTAGS